MQYSYSGELKFLALFEKWHCSVACFTLHFLWVLRKYNSTNIVKLENCSDNGENLIDFKGISKISVHGLDRNWTYLTCEFVEFNSHKTDFFAMFSKL